jgi:hypothetical protein
VWVDSESGWIAKAEREAPGFIVPTAWPVKRPAICPGYVITLPQVLEAYRAINWVGNLRERYDGVRPTALLMDCIDIAKATLGEVEAHAMQPKG